MTITPSPDIPGAARTVVTLWRQLNTMGGPRSVSDTAAIEHALDTAILDLEDVLDQEDEL